MSGHTVLHNKADFDKAIATQGKYVLIHAHEGAILDKAQEFAIANASSADYYSVDAAESPKVMEYFGISETPAAILYKDGQQVKKVEGKNAAGMQAIQALLG